MKTLSTILLLASVLQMPAEQAILRYKFDRERNRIAFTWPIVPRRPTSLIRRDLVRKVEDTLLLMGSPGERQNITWEINPNVATQSNPSPSGNYMFYVK